MSSVSRRKRKAYGAVRDFDEDPIKQRDGSDGDSGSSENNDSDGENNSASSNDRSDGSDYSGNDGDDDDDEDYSSVDLTRNQRSKKNNKASVRKKTKVESGKIKTTMKKDKNQTPKKGNSCNDSRNGGRKNVTIKVENDGSSSGKAPTGQKKNKLTDLDSFDLVLPSSIVNGGGGSSDNQCTLLVEVTDAKDSIALGEFGGSIGAIGRFESDPKGITLDLKGNQYRGSLLPGPTCLVVGFPQSFGIKRKDASTGATEQPFQDEEEAGKLKVEGIVDEYTTLVQIDDHLKKLDAVVTGNNDKGETDFIAENE